MSSKAREELIAELGWPEWAVDLAIQAEFRCEYCQRDLLADILSHDSWQHDHIVPNGDDNPENLAVTCKLCNFAKRQTDPSKGIDGQDRAVLMDAARNIVSERLAEKRTNLARTVIAVEKFRSAISKGT